MLQREVLAVTVNDDFISKCLEFVLDESKEVLLVHARREMHVRVDLRKMTQVLTLTRQ